MARMHDADLCDRIRELEEEVEKLRAVVEKTPRCDYYHYYPYLYYPWPNTAWPGGTTTWPNGTSVTYTSNNLQVE